MSTLAYAVDNYLFTTRALRLHGCTSGTDTGTGADDESPVPDARAFVAREARRVSRPNYVKTTIRYLAMGRMLNYEADKQKPRRSGVFASTAESPD